MSSTGESIRWHPRVTVARYSIAQTAWAVRRLGPVLHGDRLRTLLAEPEDGYAFDEGNHMTDAGLANVIALVSGTGGYPLAPGMVAVGLGTDSTTPFARDQGQLANAAGEASWYQGMDPGYPALLSPGVISGQAVIAGDAANWPWLEWCWAVGAGGPVPGPALAGVFAGDWVMLNRKIPGNGLGAKQLGAAWVFQADITFS